MCGSLLAVIHLSAMQTRPSKSILISGPKQNRQGLYSLEVAVRGQLSPCQGCQTIGTPFMWVNWITISTLLHVYMLQIKQEEYYTYCIY